MDIENSPNDYIETLTGEVSAKAGSAPILPTAFASQFWQGTTAEDLRERNPLDDAGLTLESWRLFESRAPGDVVIRVMNPVRARDGWQSRHTVVIVMAANMPFAVDSVLIALSQDGIITHFLNNVVFAVARNETNLIENLSLDPHQPNRELFILAEIDRLADNQLKSLETSLQQTLADLTAAVTDFPALKERISEVRDEIRVIPGIDPSETTETIEFLDWLMQDKFTFLGFREFDYRDDQIVQVGQPLGVLRVRKPASTRRLSEQSASTLAFLLEPRLLAFSKAGRKSRIHRPAYPDYIGIRKFNDAGEVVGEYGFLGLYTSRVYMDHPNTIPVVRRKIQHVLNESKFDPSGFDGRVLKQVLATYPRDELFLISEQSLNEHAVAVTNFHERRKTRLFVREDRYGLFVSCLIYLPRDLFDTRVRVAIEDLLVTSFGAEDTQYDIHLSESILVRLQYILRVPPDAQRAVDNTDLERRITAIVNDWRAELQDGLSKAFGESRGRELVIEYSDAFSAGYREYYSTDVAVADISCIESMTGKQTLNTRLYHLVQDDPTTLRLKVFHKGSPLPLSDQVPKLENLGFRITEERTYRVERSGNGRVTIHDFKLHFETQLDIAAISTLFNESFAAIWLGAAEDDSLNRLILAAGLTWHEVNQLRTYSRYMQQIRFGFSQGFISETLYRHKEIARLLVRYFESRLSPSASSDEENNCVSAVLTALDNVSLLNEDRVLRRIFELIGASLRTNYFQTADTGEHKRYLSIKFDPMLISGFPLPLPMFEIFVYSTTFEGVHLRAGRIARGGLRWSDRHEDYRTEVLGLMKAQVVKNGVIVPTGAKGGFIIKSHNGAPSDVVESYKLFISGLLDLTDNRIGQEIKAPADTRCHDQPDPYLVVAADKGTASFSDHANAVSAAYGFWLGDAFASGGSNGYDHKKMGITARGAWVSVQRHFMERGIDVQTDPVSVIGVGDMGGDVFGNGMLQSRSIHLVAAFNHLHIFLDPTPDALVSYAERERLFSLPRSSWADYDQALISPGGGVFSRQAKSIAISPAVGEVLGITQSRLSPDELIHELLKAPVDLLWNGGIGTYVKSSSESHDDVGDRANDHIRIDASELRARAIGEGGNLGFTQLARIEYAMQGGAINTDSIDNSAGVNCSDREVNIKVLLNGLVTNGDMTEKQRNLLLNSLGDEVAAIVLLDSANQARSISLAAAGLAGRDADYMRFMSRMEVSAGLHRRIEYLPSDEELKARLLSGQQLTRPELAVLLAYAKIHIKNQLVDSNIADEPMAAIEALRAFPPKLREIYPTSILDHSLRREIVASQLANTLVDSMGITFVAHHMEFVGGRVDTVARAFLVFANIFDIREWIAEIEALKDAGEPMKLELILELMRLGRHCTRWLLRHRRDIEDLQQYVSHVKPIVKDFIANRARAMSELDRDDWSMQVNRITEAGVPQEVAERTAAASKLADILAIVDASDKTGASPLDVAMDYVELSHELGIDSLIEKISGVPVSNHWQMMERNALVDNIKMQQGALASLAIVNEAGNVTAWIENHGDFVEEWRTIIQEVGTSSDQDLSMYSISCRKLQDLSSMAKD